MYFYAENHSQSNRLRKFGKNILLGLNMIAAASLLLSYLAVFINPDKIAFPAFFGLAYPYILLVNLVFIIIWGLKFKKEVFISVITILLGFTHLSNYVKLSKTDKSEYDFDLTSYNVRLFNHYDKELNSEAAIIKFLNTKHPDILCIQEFYLNGSQASVKRAFAEAIDTDYNLHTKFVRIRDNRYFGIITFSLFPIINRGDIIHPESASLSIYTDIVIGTDTVRIYNNHLQSFKLGRVERSFIEEITGANNQNEPIQEIKDLSKSLKKGFARRSVQAREVKKHMNESPFKVVTVGDFNDTPISFSYRKLRKGLNDAFVESGSGAGFTYRGKYPPNRIDYILFDKELMVSGFNIDRLKHSDHYPISAYFSFKE